MNEESTASRHSIDRKGYAMDNWVATTSYGWMVCKERSAERREPVVLGRSLAKQVRLALRHLTREPARENKSVYPRSCKLPEIVSG